MKRTKWLLCMCLIVALIVGEGAMVLTQATTSDVKLYRTGDVNDDGTVNSKDLVRMMKYFSQVEEVEVVEWALDTTGDGRVNSKDLTRMQRYLSGTAELAEIELINAAKRAELEAYLDTVSYLDFELTGDFEPYYLGRWFEKNVAGATHMMTVTDGSLLYFMTDGATEVRVNFTNITPSIAIPYFAYSIDGGAPVRQPIIAPTIYLPDSGMHTIRIIADGMTEGNGTPKWVNEEGFALKNIKVNSGAMYGIKPADKVIFYYGDSITEGINALSNAANSTSNSATNAYSWFTSEYLGAAGYVIGHGGSGLTRTGSFSTMLNAIDKLSSTRNLSDHPNADITPDLIVVNHGANDGLGGTDADTFEAALRETLARLQQKYPGVTIIYVMPFMEEWQENVQSYSPRVDKVAAELEDIHVIHTDDWGLGRGLDNTTDSLHPNRAGAIKLATRLSSEILKIVGNDFFK